MSKIWYVVFINVIPQNAIVPSLSRFRKGRLPVIIFSYIHAIQPDRVITLDSSDMQSYEKQNFYATFIDSKSWLFFLRE